MKLLLELHAIPRIPIPTDADTKMQVFLAQKCKSVFIQNQPQFGKFLNKDLNLIRIKIE